VRENPGPHAAHAWRGLAVSSRTLVPPDRHGFLFRRNPAELGAGADRGYMLQLPDDPEKRRRAMVACPELTSAAIPMVNHLTRLATRYAGAWSRWRKRARSSARSSTRTTRPSSAWSLHPGRPGLGRELAHCAGGARQPFPDARTGMEASLRFTGRGRPWRRAFSRAVGLAKLDIQPAQRGRRARRAESFRTGSEGKFNWERILE